MVRGVCVYQLVGQLTPPRCNQDSTKGLAMEQGIKDIYYVVPIMTLLCMEVVLPIATVVTMSIALGTKSMTMVEFSAEIATTWNFYVGSLSNLVLLCAIAAIQAPINYMLWAVFGMCQFFHKSGSCTEKATFPPSCKHQIMPRCLVFAHRPQKTIL